MKKIFAPIAVSAILALAACNSNNSNNQRAQDSMAHEHNHDEHDGLDHSNHDHSKDFQNEHNSKNAVDWSGEYKGIMPCADCPGIETTVKLYANETFSYKATYQDRNLTVADTGAFMWHDNGSTVHLKGKDTDLRYKVGENSIIQLDANGKAITGVLADNYNLSKVK